MAVVEVSILAVVVELYLDLSVVVLDFSHLLRVDVLEGLCNVQNVAVIRHRLLHLCLVLRDF